MDIILIPIFQVLRVAIDMYLFGLFIYAVILILETLNIVDRYNSFIYQIHSAFFLLYEPVLAVIRSLLNFKTVDISLPVLYLILYFIKQVIIQVIMIL